MSQYAPGGPLKRKQVATLREVEEALTRALRNASRCNGTIRVQKITRLHDPSGVANWDAEFEADHGGRPTAEQRRVMLAAKLGVQKRLDLADRDSDRLPSP
jgi:hypothetical protein